MYGKRKYPGAGGYGGYNNYAPQQQQQQQGYGGYRQSGGGYRGGYGGSRGGAYGGGRGGRGRYVNNRSGRSYSNHRQKPIKFDAKDTKVAEALELFRAAFKEEQAKPKPEEPEEEKKEEEAAPMEEGAEDKEKEAEEGAEEKEKKEEKKKESTHGSLSLAELAAVYKAKTEKVFQVVFKRNVKEFISQFALEFAPLVESPARFRLMTEEQQEAAKAKAEADALAVEEARKKKQEEIQAAKDAEKARQLAVHQTKERTFRSKAIHIVVASDSLLKQQAVRRAAHAVLTSTRNRKFTQLVVCGNKAPSGVGEQPMGHDEILKGASNRMRHIMALRVLSPPLPKQRGTPRSLTKQVEIYKVVSQDGVEASLKEEKESRDEQRTKVRAKVEEQVERAKKSREERDARETARKKQKTAAKTEDKKEEKTEDEAMEATDEEKEAAAEKAKEAEAAAEKEKEKAEAAEAEAVEAQKKKDEEAATAKVGREAVWAKEDEAEEARIAEEDTSEDRALMVPEFLVSIENGVVETEHPDLDDSVPKGGPVEESKLDLPEFTADDRALSGSSFYDLAWVVVYNTKSGLCARVPTTGMMLPDEDVAAAKEKGFDTTTVGSVLSERLGASLELDSRQINANDPHLTLTGRVLSRGHILEQALLTAFSILAQKVSMRHRIASLAEKKKKKAEREAREAKEKVEKEAAEAKAKEEAEAKAKEEAEAKEKEEAEAKEKEAAGEEDKKEETTEADTEMSADA